MKKCNKCGKTMVKLNKTVGVCTHKLCPNYSLLQITEEELEKLGWQETEDNY